MNQPARITALAVALAGMALTLGGCKRLAARDHLNKGVDAYKATHYEEAINHFQQATELDPNLPMAKTYLATALAQNIIPGVDSKDNLKTANQAIGIFQEVLNKDPNDVNSMKNIASIYFNTNNLDQAKAWQKKVIAVDPKDAEAAYTVAVIDWTQAHKNTVTILGANGGMTDDGEGNVKAGKKVLEQIKEKNADLVAEALQYLNIAVANRTNYDDAMTYLNLVYRRKADVDYADAGAVKADVAAAKDWSAKAMGARKENEAKKSAGPGGIVMDANGNMK